MRQFTLLIFLTGMFGLTGATCHAGVSMGAASADASAAFRQQTVDINGRRAILAAYNAGPLPTVSPNGIRLLDGGKNESNAAIFDREPGGLYRHVAASWTMSIRTGGEGASFVLLNTQRFGLRGALANAVPWDDPRVQDSFAVAFDVHDPPTSDPFNTDRNIDGQPEREVALYWDGNEIVRKLSPVEFRTGTPHGIDVLVDFVCGGANVTVQIDKMEIFGQYFIPGMSPYESRAAFGGQTSNAATTLEISDIDISYFEQTKPAPPPIVVTAIDGQLLDLGHNSQSNIANFPSDISKFGRIICTLTLAEPPGGYDPWDRKAAIYAYDDNGERFELLRFITPYHRGYTWNVDVSDYRPLLVGKRKIEAWCVTYGNGWKVSAAFSFYPGKPDRIAYRVINVWSGEPEIGNPGKPVSAFFEPRQIVRDANADFVKLRYIVTGHGQAPNTGDAAEFLPLMRTTSVNGHHYSNLLWTTDNYMNPCRPQGGTWKYDRAGWGPGNVVTPWDIDVTHDMPRGKPSLIEYTPAAYVNESLSNGNPPVHWTESQLIFYRRR